MKTVFHLLRFSLIFGLMLAATSIYSFSAGKTQAAKDLRQPLSRQAAAEQQLLEFRRQNAGASMKAGMRKAEARILLSKQMRSPSHIFYSDDMESGINGWTVETHEDTAIWHQTTSNANSPIHSWWTSDETLGSYQSMQHVDESLISPAIDLTGATGTVGLLFSESYCTERGWDFCMVDVSTNSGADWTHLRGGYGSSVSGNSIGWKLTSLDLTPFAGQTVTVRFHFDTHDSLFNAFPGWFVDNVVVFDQSASIAGNVFFDANSNGISESFDTPLEGWLITAQGEGMTFTALTDRWGNYDFRLPLGTYTITETVPTGWTPVVPGSGSYTIPLVTPGVNIDTLNFANWRHAALITGYVFNDENQNAVLDTNESKISNWSLALHNRMSGEDFDAYTNEDGSFTFVVTEADVYDLYQQDRATVQTFPSVTSGYEVNVMKLDTSYADRNFGNYFSAPPPPPNKTCYISGQVYNDLNRTGHDEDHEPGLSGVAVRLHGPVDMTAVSDSNGNYNFGPIYPGDYDVRLALNPGWLNSATWNGTLTDSARIDTADLGRYIIAPSGIGGQVFNDANLNALKDEGEAGLPGWTVQITGTNAYYEKVDTIQTTDENGNYSFTNLWAGNYTLTEVMQSRWRQTSPVNFKPNYIDLEVESTQTEVDFGNHFDNTFYVQFRTFLPESLALAKDLGGKKWGPISKLNYVKSVDFATAFGNSTGQTAFSLMYKSGIPITDTLVVTPWGSQTIDAKRLNVLISFPDGIPTSDSVHIDGRTIFPTPKSSPPRNFAKGKWTLSTGALASVIPAYLHCTYHTVIPNAADALVAGAGSNIMVGLGGPHSVLHKTWKAIGSSLIDKHGQHSGEPRCLGTYAWPYSGSIRKQLPYLAPSKGNNILFSEALALKVNIKASDLMITPIGFGDLIFDEGGVNPFNGKSIRNIAAVLDTFMSSYHDVIGQKSCHIPAGYEALDSLGIWNTIRKIDSAFCGPMGFVQISPVLVLSPVRSLEDIPYLHIDSSFSSIGRRQVSAERPPALPERYTLYQNYPNPFNPTTSIKFDLPEDGLVSLAVYNILGQEVARVLNREQMGAGQQQTEFDARHLASGVYFYRLSIEPTTDENGALVGRAFTDCKKMLLVK